MKQRQVDCPDCNGSGRTQGYLCQRCVGDGYIIATHVAIPDNVRNLLDGVKANLQAKTDAAEQFKRQDMAQRKEAMKQAAIEEITADMLRPALQLLIAKKGLYNALNELLTLDQRQELELTRGERI